MTNFEAWLTPSNPIDFLSEAFFFLVKHSQLFDSDDFMGVIHSSFLEASELHHSLEAVFSGLGMLTERDLALIRDKPKSFEAIADPLNAEDFLKEIFNFVTFNSDFHDSEALVKVCKLAKKTRNKFKWVVEDHVRKEEAAAVEAERAKAIGSKVDSRPDGRHRQAVGMSIESRRLDNLVETITSSDNIQSILAYCTDVSHKFVISREYRHELVKLYQRLRSPDYLSICQLLMCATVFEKLLRSDNKDDALLAFQFCFDLVDNEHRAFLLAVRNRLTEPKVQASVAEQSGSAVPDSTTNTASEGVQMTAVPEAIQGVDNSESRYGERLSKLKGILSGETSIQPTLQFLYSHNKSDTLILKTIKQSIESRNSVCHSATIYANAIMHAGTTVDTFLRENLVGTDSAVAGEAAGISMGLLMVGTASEKPAEMLAYAHETQHEKIIRGLSMGIALTVYGREEEADTLIEQMTRDQDPILRYGGMYALALAYSGTAYAIRQLLHFAVSDVSDDVRRTAVLALGFVMYSHPEQTPRIVSLLSESYNPHVRYGAALAVGISCVGTSLNEAIALLEPLTSDVVHFVRVGALLAMAMVMIQISEASDSRVGAFRLQLMKIISDKYEGTMSKMGAIIALGILDAGRRNLTIKLLSKSKQ